MIANETVETAQALSALAESLQTYDYNQVNQLLSKTNPSQSLSYDADGNVIQGYTPGGDVFYADYDAENRLKSIEYSDSQSGQHHRLAFSYYYNDFLARVRTYVDQAQVADLRIVRSGYLPLQDRDGSNSVQKSYTWGLNLGGGIGGLLAVTDAGQHYQYLYDGKGNVSAVLDASAQPVASYRYDAFGKLLSKSGSFEQPFMFSTKRYFQGVGLSYYGYRFYQPVMGRWLTRDPLQEDGGINLYGFVSNNPVNLFDPLGLVERDLTSSERTVVQNTINRIKSNLYWNYVGNQMQEILDKNHFKVETDFCGTGIKGQTENWDMFDRDIFLSPDILDNNAFNNEWLVEILAHEYTHYNQFSVPVISQYLFGFGVTADAIAQIITGDRSTRVPIVSFEHGAYKFGERVRKDVTGW
jgi:RHS repeat-associated protein